MVIDSCAKELGSKRHRVELPWERSGLKEILSPSSFPELKIPAPAWVDVPVSSSESIIPAGPQSLFSPLPFKRARAKLSEITWAGAEDKRLHFALQCWKIIVLDSAFHTKLGKILLAAIDQGKSKDDIFDIISDSFAEKATSTLRSRSASLLAFGRWKKSIYGEVACGIFPITEDMAYQYLCDLRRNHAAASRRKRFLEAVGLSKGLIGADVDEVLTSSRVKGVAHGGIIAERKKKMPFTVCQVDALEKLAIFSNGQVSIFAGYVCFLIHCRLRWSDGQHCIQEPTLDVASGRGFIEASLYHHKTAKKRRLKVLRLLPAAGVLPGLSGGDWASKWLKQEGCWTFCIIDLSYNASSYEGRRLVTVAFDVIGGGGLVARNSSSFCSREHSRCCNSFCKGYSAVMAIKGECRSFNQETGRLSLKAG